MEGYSTRAPENISKSEISEKLEKIKVRLFKTQNLLYADNNFALLIILQGLDASGKDSTIKHVFSCVNPMGCNVKSFKKPTEAEKKHGFLHRIYQNLPAKGMIQIFNRSHYEDILVPTAHGTLDQNTIEHRYEYINSFEHHLQKKRNNYSKIFFKHFRRSSIRKITKKTYRSTKKMEVRQIRYHRTKEQKRLFKNL